MICDLTHITTPLARKVPVVDYEIIEINNKPYYKIIKADGTHRLYKSFLTLLKNFDREDLEALWNLVKEMFSTSKPNNFSDDFLLTTLGAMFEKPDAQAQVWKNQRTVHGQAKVKNWKLLESCGVHIITFSTIHLILLVERRYPLSRFTLDQMLNAVRLRVEEESEMSFELLSAAGEELRAAKQKLMMLDSAAEERLMLLSKRAAKRRKLDEEVKDLKRHLEIVADEDERAAKRRRLDEEVEDLKRHLEIVPDEDDDVYTEATLPARKVSVVDYEIIEINNKLYYKIIKADGTHQLYRSFLTLLKNFDKE
nr:hypothetical protein [Tanacetum cinerariifolium]